MENLPNRLEQVMEYDSVQKIKQYPIGYNQTATEFVIPYADHTIATIIADELRAEKNVQYVGIRQPHPLETSMYLRVLKDQDDYTVQDVFIDALKSAQTKLKTLLADYEQTCLSGY